MSELPTSKAQIADGVDLVVYFLATSAAAAAATPPVVSNVNAPRSIYMDLLINGQRVERTGLHNVDQTISSAAKLEAYEWSRHFLKHTRPETSLTPFQQVEWKDSDGELG